MFMLEPPDVRSHLWNWHDNVDEGIVRLGVKRTVATVWINDQISQQMGQDANNLLENKIFFLAQKGTKYLSGELLLIL